MGWLTRRHAREREQRLVTVGSQKSFRLLGACAPGESPPCCCGTLLSTGCRGCKAFRFRGERCMSPWSLVGGAAAAVVVGGALTALGARLAGLCMAFGWSEVVSWKHEIGRAHV